MKYRLKFQKIHRMRFIGHLDLMKLFQRSMMRADIPIAYSNGFNPHQIMSFASPLPLGHSSICEILEIKLTKQISENQIIEALNLVLPEGLKILDCTKMSESEKSLAALLRKSVYEITLDIPIDLNYAVEKLLSQKEIFINKKSKKGTSQINIREDIYYIKPQNPNTKLEALLKAGSFGSLKPESLVLCLYKCIDMEYDKYKIKYLRKELCTKTEECYEENYC